MLERRQVKYRELRCVASVDVDSNRHRKLRNTQEVEVQEPSYLRLFSPRRECAQMGLVLCRATLEAGESLGQVGQPSLSRKNIYCVVRGFSDSPRPCDRWLATLIMVYPSLDPITISSASVNMASFILSRLKEVMRLHCALRQIFVGVLYGPVSAPRLLQPPSTPFTKRTKLMAARRGS